MWKTFFIIVVIIAISMVFLAIKILVKKHGRFPNTHIGHSAEMRKRGITCVQSMDHAERKQNPNRIMETSPKNRSTKNKKI